MTWITEAPAATSGMTTSADTLCAVTKTPVPLELAFSFLWMVTNEVGDDIM